GGRAGFCRDAGGLGGKRVGRGRDGEAVRHGKAGAPQLAEIRTFATGLGEIRRGQLIKRPNKHRPILGRIETSNSSADGHVTLSADSTLRPAGSTGSQPQMPRTARSSEP